MRPLATRLWLLVAVLAAVFFLNRSSAPVAKTIRAAVGWATTVDLPSDATVTALMTRVGIKRPGSAATTAQGTSQTAAALQIVWPLSGAVVTPFSPAPASGNGASGTGTAASGTGTGHPMVTIRAAAGSPVLSASSGVVTGVTKGKAGSQVSVADGPYTFIYQGLGDLTLKDGSAVKKGDVLGYLYHTGPGDAAALGFEVTKGGTPLDPSSLLPGGAGS